MAGKIKKFKELINKHPAWIGVVSLVILLACIAWQFRPAGKLSAPPLQPIYYFYDLTTSKLFAGDTENRPDLARSPSGGDVARAQVFSCGDCAQEDQRIVAWLEMEEFAEGKTPEDPAKATSAWEHAMDDGDDQGDEATVRLWIRKPGETKWRPRTTAEEHFIQVAIQTRCAKNGGTAKPCVPSLGSATGSVPAGTPSITPTTTPAG